MDAHTTSTKLEDLCPSKDAVDSYRRTAISLLTYTLIEIGVFDALPARDQNAISVSRLGRTLNIAPDVLRRLLSAVEAEDIVERVEPDSYKSTEYSIKLRSNTPDAKFGRMMNTFMFATLPYLTYWKDMQKRDDPRTPGSVDSPFTLRFGAPGQSFYDVLSWNPDLLQTMHAGLETMDNLNPFLGDYDFVTPLMSGGAAKSEGIRLVDIGGGDGRFVAELIRQYPQIEPHNCLVQDLKQAIQVARQNPHLHSSVHICEHDFFQPQPVREASVYHLRHILHNWNDEECIRILAHIADAMGFSSQLVIAENILQYADDGATFAHLMDIAMLLIGGKERTLAEFSQLLDAAGLKLVRVHPVGSGSWAFISATKA